MLFRSRARRRGLQDLVDAAQSLSRPLDDHERVLLGRWRLELPRRLHAAVGASLHGPLAELGYELG